MENIANTPTRAIAISKPIAKAISLPSNHFAIALETVIPAISQPQPKIIKPKAAIFALPGIAIHQEFSHSFIPVVWNQSLMPMNLITAPMNIREADKVPVKRIPHLSSIIPAIIRNPHTLRIYSPAA